MLNNVNKTINWLLIALSPLTYQTPNLLSTIFTPPASERFSSTTFKPPLNYHTSIPPSIRVTLIQNSGRDAFILRGIKTISFLLVIVSVSTLSFVV